MPHQALKRHPIRGGIAGLCLGLSLAIALFLANVIVIDRTGVLQIGGCIVFGVLVGIGWAFVAPTRQTAERHTGGPATATMSPPS